MILSTYHNQSKYSAIIRCREDTWELFGDVGTPQIQLCLNLRKSCRDSTKIEKITKNPLILATF